MAKVGVELGVTMHIGRPDNNEYLKFTVKVDDVDTEKELGPQLEETKAVLNNLIGFVETGLEKKITEELKRNLR